MFTPPWQRRQNVVLPTQIIRPFHKAGNILERITHRGNPNLPLHTSVYGTLHCANKLGLPHVLRAPIHQLSVHQSEPKPSMRRGCFYCVFIFDLTEQNAQLFFGKARQTAACRARFSVLRLASARCVLKHIFSLWRIHMIWCSSHMGKIFCQYFLF